MFDWEFFGSIRHALQQAFEAQLRLRNLLVLGLKVTLHQLPRLVLLRVHRGRLPLLDLAALARLIYCLRGTVGPEILLHYILYLSLDSWPFEALLFGLLDDVDDGFEPFLIEGYFIQAGIIVVFGGGLVLPVGKEQNFLHPLLAHPLEIVARVSLRLPVQLPQLLHAIILNGYVHAK